MTVTLLLCGPTYLLPDSLYILGSGCAILGVSSLLISVAALVEMNQAIKKAYGIEKSEKMANSVSSTYAIFMATGLIIGPFYG